MQSVPTNGSGVAYRTGDRRGIVPGPVFLSVPKRSRRNQKRLQNTFESIDLRLLGGIHLTGVPVDNANALLARPRLVALLATLAITDTPWLRRDQIIALFWPDLPQERARAALRKSVYLIRQALGDDAVVNRGAEELGLAPHVTTDFARFRAARAAGDPGTALEVYGGELLPAFHLADAPEWERWLDETRARLRAQAISSASALIAGASDQQYWNAAVHWARRAADISPDDESVTRKLIEVLDQAGDRAGAMQVYRAFEQRLRSEYDGTPAPETIRLFERILARAAPYSEVEAELAIRGDSAAAAHASPDSDSLDDDNSTAEVVPARRTTRGEAEPAPDSAAGTVSRARAGWPVKRAIVSAVVFAVLIAIVLGRRNDRARAVNEFAPIAVGGIVDYTGGTDSIGAALADLLATSLARVPGLPVLSNSRLIEIMADPSVRQHSISWAARRAGARGMLEGAVHRQDDGLLRLELRRVDLESGAIVASFSSTGPTLLDLTSRITVQIASSMQLTPPAQPLAGVTTSSDTAYLLYERGLRAYYREDAERARHYFERALAVDSTFAQAAWYLARTLTWKPGWIPMFERAVRLSAHATDRERLMILADWAHAMDDPSLLASAETLSTRYPLEPSGHLMAGVALMNADRPLDAVPHFRRVIQLDTLSLLEVTATCRACDAIWLLGGAYGMADSADAGERVIRAWVKANPRLATAAGELAYKLEYLGRYDEAEHMLRTMHELDSKYQTLESRLAGLEMARGRFAQAERYARDALRLHPQNRGDRHWLLAITLMNQGRLREALAHADSFRVHGANTGSDPAYLRGLVLTRMQRGREAAALFDSIARLPDPHKLPKSRRGRQLAGQYLHVAEALAVEGDTAGVRNIEAFVRDHGAFSGYARDQRLHHYVHGLRRAHAGQHAEAAAAFRQALFGAAGGGYPPVAVELGRALLASNRAREAIYWLEASIRGPVGAGGIWIWRTEVHELLALAYERTGQRERALEQYHIAHEALQSADPELAPMRARIAGRIAALADR